MPQLMSCMLCCRVLAYQVLPVDLSAGYQLCDAQLSNVWVWPVRPGAGWNLAAVPNHHLAGLYL